MTAQELKQAITAEEQNDATLSRLGRLIESGRADYMTMKQYAERLGDVLSRALGKAFNFADDEFIADEIANELFGSTLRNAYRLTTRQSAIVQKSLNDSAGISINALTPNVNEERIINTVEKLTSAPFGETKFLIGNDSLSNFCYSAVVDTIEENASFQREAGLKSYIERDPGGGCCAWCESKAGRFEYGSQPKDFFAVHKDCTCVITFMPSKRNWAKITYKNDSSGRLRKITERVG